MGNEVCLVRCFVSRLHPTPYQEVIMGGDGDNQILHKLKAVSCGGHMIDVITGFHHHEL